ICVGTPISGRTHQEVEGLIGFFVNMLALRSDLSQSPTFNAFLQQVKDTTLEAYENQDAPFERVVESVAKDRDPARSPLFQIMFAFQNVPRIPELVLGDLVLQQEETGHATTQYELFLSLEESGSGLKGTVEYCTDLFSHSTIAAMMSHYEQL